MNKKEIDETAMRDGLNTASRVCHQASVDGGWWPENKESRNKPELLMLMVSEIAEAMEAFRKDLMDSHLPHRKGFEVELADLEIRLHDLAGAMGLDLGGAVIEKMEYNRNRADHKLENRAKPGGKKF